MSSNFDFISFVVTFNMEQETQKFAEGEFLAEMEMITITPSFKADVLQLLSVGKIFA